MAAVNGIETDGKEVCMFLINAKPGQLVIVRDYGIGGWKGTIGEIAEITRRGTIVLTNGRRYAHWGAKQFGAEDDPYWHVLAGFDYDNVESWLAAQEVKRQAKEAEEAEYAKAQAEWKANQLLESGGAHLAFRNLSLPTIAAIVADLCSELAAGRINRIAGIANVADAASYCELRFGTEATVEAFAAANVDPVQLADSREIDANCK
jgi:hypothetical protein